MSKSEVTVRILSFPFAVLAQVLHDYHHVVVGEEEEEDHLHYMNHQVVEVVVDPLQQRYLVSVTVPSPPSVWVS